MVEKTNKTGGESTAADLTLDMDATQVALASILAEALVRSGALSMESLLASLAEAPERYALGNWGQVTLKRFQADLQARLSRG